jgi:hypothetical protein
MFSRCEERKYRESLFLQRTGRPARVKIMTLTMTPPAEKTVPLGIALGVLGVILMGGGLLIWKYVYRPAAPVNVMHVTVPTPANPRMVGGDGVDGTTKFNVVQTAGEADLPDGVHAGTAGNVLIKAGDAYMRVSPGEKDRTRVSFGYFTVKDGEWEHGYVTQGIRRILTQDDFAKELAVTEEQKTKLKELPEAPASKWPEKDRERFIAQYQMWAAAKGDESGKLGAELVKGLKEFGEKKRTEDLKLMTDRVSRAKGILNEKQLGQINPIPKWEVKGTPPNK